MLVAAPAEPVQVRGTGQHFDWAKKHAGCFLGEKINLWALNF
jgi:hypothetical protein